MLRAPALEDHMLSVKWKLTNTRMCNFIKAHHGGPRVSPGAGRERHPKCLASLGLNVLESAVLVTCVSEPWSLALVAWLPLPPNVALFFFFSDPAIVNGVYWSESLNKVFVDNFDRDPSLIWQYFGSAKGFFRQYPGECA